MSMSEGSSIVNLNGDLCPASEACIRVDDRGFLLADGLFETLYAVSGVVLGAAAHAARIRAGATVMGLPAPPDAAGIALLAGSVLAANHWAGPNALAAVRLTWTRGSGPRGLDSPSDESTTPTLLVTAALLATPRHSYGPAHAVVAPWPLNEASPLVRFKSLAFSERIIARHYAAGRGADVALFVNTSGHLAGADAANVFLLQDRVLRTPSVEDGAVPGTMRAAVVAAARHMDLGFKAGPIAVEDLERAAAVFLTNTLIGVRPLSSVNNKNLGDERITKHLIARLAAHTERGFSAVSR